MPLDGVKIGGGFSEGELKFASFWVRNRIVLTRAGYSLLIALSVIVWLYALWGILDAFVISYPRESRLTAEIAANQITLNSLDVDKPQAVQAGTVAVLEGTDGRFDMVADVQNPNEQWWLEFNYHFNISGQQTPMRNGFILPQSQNTLTELGYKPKSRGNASAQLVVDNIRWHRLDRSVVSTTYKDYELQHFNVAFENVKFESGLVIGSRQIGRTVFDMVNRGSFGYWNMDVIVKLYRGNGLLAVQRITLTNIVPGETRHIELDWFDKLPPQITRTEITPVINFLDANSYLPTQRF